MNIALSYSVKLLRRQLRMHLIKMAKRHDEFGRMRASLFEKSGFDIVDNHIPNFFHTVMRMQKIGCKSRRCDIRQMLVLANGFNLGPIKPAQIAYIDERNHLPSPF
jgi:hypothetical protein